MSIREIEILKNSIKKDLHFLIHSQCSHIHDIDLALNRRINNAIKKASGSNENYEEVTYEGYGTNGVAVIVSAATDNRNRTAADVRHAFDKSGGNLGTTGCVSYLFNKKGLIVIDRSTTNLDEDSMMMLALDSGAEDFEASEEIYGRF